MNDTVMVEVKKLKKVFVTPSSKVVALKGIDLAIREGESLGIMGVSGSGKSTLLHILGTLDRPTEGEVLYRGENIFLRGDDDISAFRNKQIGFVFQSHYLLSEFTALENVMMPAIVQGIEMRKAKEMAASILRRVGLLRRLRHRPGELSGGEQQRVAIARAIVLKPKMILADEPTGNLDLETGMSVLDLLLSLNSKEKITMVVVTHSPEVAKQLGRRIRLLDGKIVDEN
ncbi:MAG TPA: ABC transporter ATP-binding protein [Thermodesulfobacteriota bacterium]|nr:ABC transporter ATP-binding protein [Thermodesulfobacteriota bacterium]